MDDWTSLKTIPVWQTDNLMHFPTESDYRIRRDRLAGFRGSRMVENTLFYRVYCKVQDEKGIYRNSIVYEKMVCTRIY